MGEQDYMERWGREIERKMNGNSHIYTGQNDTAGYVYAKSHGLIFGLMYTVYNRTKFFILPFRMSNSSV